MQVDVVSDADALAALAPDWARLDARDRRAEFLTTLPVVRAWWASYGADAAYGLEVLVARHNGAVVGILPLARQRISVHKVERTLVRFASHGDWMGVVVDPALDPDTVCRALLAHVDADPTWDILSLDGIRGSSALAAFALGSDRWNRALAHRVEHPRIDLAGVASLAEFEAAGRVPAKTRKYRGRLLREHDVRFVVREGDEGEMLARLGRLHALEKEHLIRDAGRTERHSWFEDPLRRGHYAGLFATRGAVVTFGYERPDGELVAARSAFRHGRALLSWTSAYHPDLRDYRLGKVIQYDLLDHVLRAGDVDVFDFGAGRYPWKFEWTSAFESSYRLRVDRAAPSGAAPSGAGPSGAGLSAAAPSGAEPAGAATARGRAIGEGPSLRAGSGSAPGAGRTATEAAPSTAPEPRDPVGARLRRRLRRVRHAVGRRLTTEEVWYLARPGEELTGFGALLDGLCGARVHLVHVSPWATPTQRRAVDAELRAALDDSALARATRAELVAAAEALGIPEERVHADLTVAPSGWARRTAVRAAMAAHPHATHRVVAADAGVAALVRAEAARLGAGVVDVVTATPAAPDSTPALAVAAAYRRWDPDSGRYAVHRSPASRFLASVATSPQA